MSSMEPNLVPPSHIFKFANRKESLGAKSWEYSGWGSNSIKIRRCSSATWHCFGGRAPSSRPNAIVFSTNRRGLYQWISKDYPYDFVCNKSTLVSFSANSPGKTKKTWGMRLNSAKHSFEVIIRLFLCAIVSKHGTHFAYSFLVNFCTF